MSSAALRTLAIGLGALLGGAAEAADFPELTPIESDPAAFTAAWYIRADAGYTFESSSGGTIDIYDPDFDGADSIDYDDLRLDWNHDVSVGTGYQFTDHLRGEVSVGHWSRDFEGKAEYAGLNHWDYRATASVEAWEALASAYVDVGRYGRFTPYVGAGAGITRIKYGTLTNEASSAGGDYVGTQPGETSHRFTWALMAGTAIDIVPSWKLDLGYRFSHVEGGAAFGWDEFDTAAGLTGTQIRDDGFKSHQLRIGVRKHFY
jgi:opacity protein-like surface antigen